MYLLKMKINDLNDLELKKCFLIIKPFKQEKIKRLATESLKKESIVGEYLLIKGLKEYFDIDYKEIEIVKNDNGKPFIKDKNIYFSISHSYGLIVCAISNKNIGIDVEKIKPISLKTIDMFASIHEKNYITKTYKNIEERFFTIYTLKEAYVKMYGFDLKMIKDCEFEINKNNFICINENVNIKSIKYEDYIIGIIEKKVF